MGLQNKIALIDGQEMDFDAYTSSYTEWLEEEFKRAGREYMGKGFIVWEDGKISETVRHFWKMSSELKTQR